MANRIIACGVFLLTLLPSGLAQTRQSSPGSAWAGLRHRCAVRHPQSGNEKAGLNRSSSQGSIAEGVRIEFGLCSFKSRYVFSSDGKQITVPKAGATIRIQAQDRECRTPIICTRSVLRDVQCAAIRLNSREIYCANGKELFAEPDSPTAPGERAVCGYQVPQALRSGIFSKRGEPSWA